MKSLYKKEIAVFNNLQVEANTLIIAEKNKHRTNRSQSESIKECLAFHSLIDRHKKMSEVHKL